MTSQTLGSARVPPWKRRSRCNVRQFFLDVPLMADYHRLSPNCHTMITSCLPENLGSLPSKRRPNMSLLLASKKTRAQAIAENCLKRLKEDELHRTPISFGATLPI